MNNLAMPPLVPRVDAILVLDGDGQRLAAKYYNNFLSSSSSSATTNNNNTKSLKDVQSVFERQLFSKITSTATSDAAEVVSLGNNQTAVFCGGGITHSIPPGGNIQNIIQQPHQMGGTAVGGDVRVVIVGPSNESELVLASFAEGLFEALSNLMGGQTDRSMILDNLELVLLLIDEHCDGGIVLEIDPYKMVNSVLLKEMGSDAQGDAMPSDMQPGMGHGLSLGNIHSGEMTIAQALRQAREQIITGLAQRDGGI
mmetsp:Transcript_14184/g.20973  ORF Transcript_14184/g.20973 Transcript_14184/m.20973 type:complete len:255 (-) Transcript_14184:85-849(-)